MSSPNRLFLSMFFFVALLSAQEETRTETLKPFFQVKAFDGLSVTLVPSDRDEVLISGEDIDKVAVVQNAGTLKLRMEIDKIFGGYRTFVTVYHSETLRVLDVNEDAKLSVEKPVETDVLEVKAQEGGSIFLDCQVEQLLVKSVSGGDIRVTGTARTQDIIINTGGMYMAKDFLTRFTTVKVSAGGRAEIHATDYVGAHVKAGGRVIVFGDPLKMDEKTLFGGRIERQSN